jgi:hypothetical protein
MPVRRSWIHVAAALALTLPALGAFGCAFVAGIQDPNTDAKCEFACGGECGKCPKAGCQDDAECWSGRCQDNKCAPPGCGDDLFNGTETDVDCGSLTELNCKRCGSGQRCVVNENCEEGSHCSSDCTCAGGGGANECTAGLDTCGDGVRNGGETDVDCGGPCPKCADGKECYGGNEGADCQSGECRPVPDENTSRCIAPGCDDEVKNGDETDTDCGGSCVDGQGGGECKVGQGCEVDADCKSTAYCEGGACALLGCSNGVKDGNETDTDCGGSCAEKAGALCYGGQVCVVDADCRSASCDTTDGECLCVSDADCVSGNCNINTGNCN